VSKAEFDQRSAQAESARRQYEVARNSAAQQYQALVAARARVALALKAVDDTVVRAPFEGVVGERLVSVGDYVTRGTKVASVMRIDPIRIELTIPEQYIGEVGVGHAVNLEVNAYPGRTFTGQVRYISPGLRVDSRALVVEAVVRNPSGELKPGLFASARIAQASQQPAILVPRAAIATVADTPRVYVVSGDVVEERIVTTGQAVDELIEITSGLKAGEMVATSNVAQLRDGQRVSSSR
jgi:RND family efflux transporter MFP subunit